MRYTFSKSPVYVYIPGILDFFRVLLSGVARDFPSPYEVYGL